MERVRKVLAAGKDHTDMFPIFRSLIEKTGAKKGDALIWAGCAGACYSMATFFSYYIDDLGLELYFATDAELGKLRRLERVEQVGVVAGGKAEPLKANIIVLMSGLASVPFENVTRLVQEGLTADGIVMGETVVPGLFEELKWHERIPIRYSFEFTMKNPTAVELQ